MKILNTGQEGNKGRGDREKGGQGEREAGRQARGKRREVGYFHGGLT